MKITTDEVKHVATLAHLELSSTEIGKYGNQLSDILSYVDQLSGVDVSEVDPTAQVTGMVNVFREDEISEWNKDEVAKTLAEVPEVIDGQIMVKRVL